MHCRLPRTALLRDKTRLRKLLIMTCCWNFFVSSIFVLDGLGSRYLCMYAIIWPYMYKVRGYSILLYWNGISYIYPKVRNFSCFHHIVVTQISLTGAAFLLYGVFRLRWLNVLSCLLSSTYQKSCMVRQPQTWWQNSCTKYVRRVLTYSSIFPKAPRWSRYIVILSCISSLINFDCVLVDLPPLRYRLQSIFSWSSVAGSNDWPGSPHAEHNRLLHFVKFSNYMMSICHSELLFICKTSAIKVESFTARKLKVRCSTQLCSEGSHPD